MNLFNLFTTRQRQQLVCDPQTIAYEPIQQPKKREKPERVFSYEPVQLPARKQRAEPVITYDPVPFVNDDKILFVPTKPRSTAMPPLVNGVRPDFNSAFEHIHNEREILNPLPKKA